MKRLPTDGTFLFAWDAPLHSTPESFAKLLTECGIPITPNRVSIQPYNKHGVATALISLKRDVVAALLNAHLDARGKNLHFGAFDQQARNKHENQVKNLPPLQPMHMA